MSQLHPTIAQALAPWTPPAPVKTPTVQELLANEQWIKVVSQGHDDVPLCILKNLAEDQAARARKHFAALAEAEEARWMAADLEAMRKKQNDPFRQREADAAQRREADFEQMQRSLRHG